MARTLTASDRRSLIRLASTMPVGSPERKAILAGLRLARSYKDYVTDAKADGKKPMEKDEWEARFGGGGGADSGSSPKEQVDTFSKSVKAINWKNTDSALAEVKQMVKGLDKFVKSALMGGDEVEDAVDEFKEGMEEVLASLDAGDSEFAKVEFKQFWDDFKEVLKDKRK